jgi:hypothetical protein
MHPLQVLGKSLDSTCIVAPIQENAISEVGHNRDCSSHSPFLHAAPVQGTHAPDANFESSRAHLYRE